VAAAVALGAVTGGGRRALAADAAATDGDGADAHVPVAANFSVTERVVIVTAGVGGLFALVAGPRVFSTPSPSLGPPAAGSFDRRISDALYSDDGSGSRFLGRVPDYAGLYVLPYLPALAYGFETFWLEHSGQPVQPRGDLNPDHRLWAYLEALGWTVLITGVTKMVVGRTRPYAVLDHPALAGPASEQDVSFFSGHSSAMFCAATFVSLDLSAWLTHRVLRDASTTRRVLLGWVVPYTVSFGLATLVGVSRIVDQQHWATDVLVGAAVGSTASYIAYSVHFDDAGNPRRRHTLTVGPMVGASPGAPGGHVATATTGIALSGVFQ
jgi:membrane-associated phospholipid phosphatase